MSDKCTDCGCDIELIPAMEPENLDGEPQGFLPKEIDMDVFHYAGGIQYLRNQLVAAEKLCEIYFRIAVKATDEIWVRSVRDLALMGIEEKIGLDEMLDSIDAPPMPEEQVQRMLKKIKEGINHER